MPAKTLDPAILEIARALARAAARQEYARLCSLSLEKEVPANIQGAPSKDRQWRPKAVEQTKRKASRRKEKKHQTEA